MTTLLLLLATLRVAATTETMQAPGEDAAKMNRVFAGGGGQGRPEPHAQLCPPSAAPDNSLSVSIPEPSPLRAPLGSTITIPCYFIDPVLPVTTAPATAPLSPRIKWSRVAKDSEVVLLVATEGQVRVSSAYQDRASLPNYPAIPSDVTLELQQLRTNDSGVYRCEVVHGIEDSQATLEVLVKGEGFPPMCRGPTVPIPGSIKAMEWGPKRDWSGTRCPPPFCGQAN